MNLFVIVILPEKDKIMGVSGLIGSVVVTSTFTGWTN